MIMLNGIIAVFYVGIVDPILMINSIIAVFYVYLIH